MLILVLTFDVGKFCNEKKKGFQSVHIWIFLSVPYCLVSEEISIKQFFFFFFIGQRNGP